MHDANPAGHRAASPVADTPRCRNGALPKVAGLDVGWLRAGAADRVLVAVLVVVLAGVNLAARHQALPVALAAGDGALRPLPGDPDVFAGRQPAALHLQGPFAGVAVGAALHLLVLIHAEHLAVPNRLPACLQARLPFARSPAVRGALGELAVPLGGRLARRVARCRRGTAVALHRALLDTATAGHRALREGTEVC